MKAPSRTEIAQHLDLSGGAVLRELVAKGILPATGTLDEYRAAYIKHLRGRAAGHVSEDGLDLTAERARLAKEQADRIAMENAEARGEQARWEDVEAFLVPLLSSMVQRVRAVPAKAAPEAHGAATIAEAEAAYRRDQDDALRDVVEILVAGPREVRRRVGSAAAERRRRARQRPAPAEPADGARVGGDA